MDNFLGTLIFLLPGVMVYFWLQSFGLNPVTKHSPTEFTAVSALLWLPVSITTIMLYNLSVKLATQLALSAPIWTISALKNASENLLFLTIFLLLSVAVSFLLSALWSVWGYPVHQKIINKVREWRGIAPFSDTSSVWDEVFGKNEPQVVEIGKIDKSGETMIGAIKKVSRPFEPERNICLEDVDYFTELILKNNDIPVVNIFYDTKSGTYIKVFDQKKIDEVQ